MSNQLSTIHYQLSTINVPIVEVTILEDRALVKRRGTVNLDPGLWRLHLEKVSPILADKSLRGEFLAGEGARLEDIRVRRSTLLKEEHKPEQIQPLLKEMRQLVTDFHQLAEDREHQENYFAEINYILTKTLAEIPEDAVWGQLDQKSWRSQLTTLFEQFRSLRSEILDSYFQQEDKGEKIQALKQRIEALVRPDFIYDARIEADVTIQIAGEYELEIEYIVPNAFWRPWHQARLLLTPDTSEPTVSFRCDGCVWQRTGEDWNKVNLVFSTARASLGNEPPLLTEDRLKVQDKAKKIAVSTREEKIETTGAGVKKTDTIQLPGVDDGGEVRTLRPLHKATIPSDGRPYRVPLFSFQSEAKIENILMPEQSLQVVLKSEQVNNGSSPILAGPVDLVRSSEFVGKTTVMFIAPGEKFALGWGPDSNLRVQRTEEEKEEKNLLTQWKLKKITTKLFLSNIGPEGKLIRTTERVPVSEIEQVKVKVITKGTTGGVKPDENGFCTWDFNLEPYSQLKATLSYQIESAPEVLEQ